jgi:hypothetical protein
VGRKHSDPGAIGVARSLALLPLVLIASSSRWERPGNRLSKSLLGGGLGVDLHLHHGPMLDQFISALRGAVSLDALLAGKKHQMHSAEPEQSDVKHSGPRQMDRNFGLVP